MIIRSVTAEDLEKFKSLVEYKEYFDSNNIWLEQSKVCVANNGDLLGFALIKPNSLYEFWGGKIPEDNSSLYDKFWIKEYFNHSFKEYEVLFYLKEIKDYYLDSDGVDDTYVPYLLSHIVYENEEGNVEGIFWTKERISEFMSNFYSVNNTVYVDFPTYD